MKRFSLLFFFLISILLANKVSAVDYPPGIFLNNIPGSIEVREGQTPVIPIFLLMGPYTNQEVEFFVWREWQGEAPGVENAQEYLDENLQWRPFEEFGDITPLVRAALPFYAHLNWVSDLFLSPFDWQVNPPSPGLSYKLYVCLDAKVDGHPPTQEELSSSPPQAVCNQTSVVFLTSSEEACVPSAVQLQGAESGIKARFYAGFPVFYIYPVISDCGAVACQVESLPPFVSASFEDHNLRVDFKSDLAPGTYQGEIRLSCSGKVFSVPVEAIVDPTPGNCAGTLFLKDSYGQEYQSGATIYLASNKSFQVICRQKVFIMEGESVVSAYAFSWDKPCITAENQNGSLILTPLGEEGCTTNFVVGSGEARATYTIKCTEASSATCSPLVTPTSLTFSSSGTKTVSVKDSCGKPLTYRVISVSHSWITAPRAGSTGTGSLNISVSTTGLSAGTYRGKVIIQPEGGEQVTISVTLSVPRTTSTSTILTVWPPEVSVSLEAGASASEEITATCSGRVPSSCTATKASGGDWLKVSGCNGAQVSLTLDATGLTSGQTYSGAVTINTSCGSKTVPVTLTVSGVCEPSSVKVSQATVLVSTQVGSSPSAKTVSVTDNCGRALAFEISNVTYNPTTATEWLDPSGSNGSLTLYFSTASLSTGTYTATITLNTSLGEATVTVELTVSDTPEPVTTAIALPGYPDLYTGTFNGGEAKLFYFTAKASSTIPLSVSAQVPSSYGFGYLNMLLVNAGPDCSAAPPTLAQIQELISQYKAGQIPSAGSSGSIWWNLGGNLVKRIQIYNIPEPTCWYLLVYNSSSTSYSNATVAYSAP